MCYDLVIPNRSKYVSYLSSSYCITQHSDTNLCRTVKKKKKHTPVLQKQHTLHVIHAHVNTNMFTTGNENADDIPPHVYFNYIRGDHLAEACPSKQITLEDKEPALKENLSPPGE